MTETEIYRQALEYLVCAHGTLCNDAAFKDAEEATLQALEDVENAFCRADREGYEQWARDYAAECGVVLEPCDTWHDMFPEPSPWIDGSLR